ncbi:MAG: threonine/serine exporter family protein [Selenomonas sp.]|uniref:threonine/serine ThrE exporter family protein n=1 Tax=Selenomonas sp. TaxID=2053611 RepID=UPI0025D41A89|nr:threonine/serine exporter family protein [Selenomonas sp.]MCR5757453.1 threonine/serine exporter family protein [Selenomonas sp.]
MNENTLSQTREHTELETVLFAGTILVSSGSEVQRTEDTLHHIALSMKMRYLDAFVTNRGIFATGEKANGQIETRVVSVPETDVNIDKIEAVNELSRKIASQETSTSVIWSELDKINRCADYSSASRVLAYGLGALCFSYAIGTSVRDSLCAAIIGLLIGFFMLHIHRWIKAKVLITILASALIALLGNLCLHLGVGEYLPVIILGVMIDLVPGVPFVNAVREFSQNNFSTGVTLLMSALLSCVSMAAGVASVQLFMPDSVLVSMVFSNADDIGYPIMLMRSIMAGIGTTAFCVMFRVRQNHFGDCGLLGAITWFIYMDICSGTGNGLLAVFISGLLVSIVSRILAVTRKCPVIVFLMTSLFPLLPGISFYMAVYYLLAGLGTLALDYAMKSFLIAFTLAVSIVLIQQISVNPRYRKWPTMRFYKQK